MIATIDGRDVQSLRIRCPRLGAWHAAECEIAGSDPIAVGSVVTISIDGQEWRGTVVDSHSFTGSTTLHIVGGAGGLSKRVPSQHYREPSPDLVIRAILTAVGETLDPSSAIPATKLPHWVSFAGQASHALTAIVDKAGLAWRVLPSGKIWVGTETWPVAEPEGVEIQDEDWSDGSIFVAGESFAELQKIAPGTTYDGHQLEQVEHRIDGLRVRTVPQISSVDTAAREFLSAIRREMDHALPYPCKVVSQNADLTLQLVPEDPRMPSDGLDGIPIRPGLPGWAVRVKTGARVRVCFDSGDRSKPYATAWDLDASSVEELQFMPGAKGFRFVLVGDTLDVVLPAGALIAGTVSGQPFTGALVSSTPAKAIVVGPGTPNLKN